MFSLKNMMVAVIAAALLLTSGDALAHRVKSCLSTINWQASNDNKVQVTHRVHYHDAVEIHRKLKPKGSQETLFDVTGQARMALHMDKDFVVTIGGEAIKFSPIGGEVDGDYLYIYLESDQSVTGVHVTVQSDIFRSDYTGVVNRVLLKRGVDEYSATLKKKAEVKAFTVK